MTCRLLYRRQTPALPSFVSILLLGISSRLSGAFFIFPLETDLVTRCSHSTVSKGASQSRRSCNITGVTLKVAIDVNGATVDLGSEKSERFTCSASLDAVHRLRADCQAVLVGKSTVLADNPSLLVRRGVPVENQVLRVVLDSHLELLRDGTLQSLQLFNDGFQTIAFHHCPDSYIDRPEALSPNVQLIKVPTTPNGNLCPSTVVKVLREQFQVYHLLVEGGPSTARSFLSASLVDRVMLVRATKVIFNKDPLPSGLTSTALLDAGLECLGSKTVDDDVWECWSSPGCPWPSGSLEAWP